MALVAAFGHSTAFKKYFAELLRDDNDKVQKPGNTSVIEVRVCAPSALLLLSPCGRLLSFPPRPSVPLLPPRLSSPLLATTSCVYVCTSTWALYCVYVCGVVVCYVIIRCRT